jgi:hypothetical protein
MDITKESIEDLLNYLFKPMFDGIVEIEIETLYYFDNVNQLYPQINVIFDRYKYIELRAKDSNIDDKVMAEVKSTLKYFNIHNSIVSVYITSN